MDMMLGMVTMDRGNRMANIPGMLRIIMMDNGDGMARMLVMVLVDG